MTSRHQEGVSMIEMNPCNKEENHDGELSESGLQDDQNSLGCFGKLCMPFTMNKGRLVSFGFGCGFFALSMWANYENATVKINDGAPETDWDYVVRATLLLGSMLALPLVIHILFYLVTLTAEKITRGGSSVSRWLYVLYQVLGTCEKFTWCLANLLLTLSMLRFPKSTVSQGGAGYFLETYFLEVAWRVLFFFVLWYFGRFFVQYGVLHVAQRFNSRTYLSRLHNTLHQEFVLMILQNRSVNAVVNNCVLIKSGHEDVARRNVFAQYVCSHHVNSMFESLNDVNRSTDLSEMHTKLAKNTVQTIARKLSLKMNKHGGLDLEKEEFSKFFNTLGVIEITCDEFRDIIDPEKRGRIDYKYFLSTTKQMFQDRIYVAGSLLDSDTLLLSLDSVMNGCMLILVLAVYLGVLAQSVSNFWSVIASVFFSFTFVFGSTLSTWFKMQCFYSTSIHLILVTIYCWVPMKMLSSFEKCI